MTLAPRKPVARREFFTWAEAQGARHGFDGVQPAAMTGGSLGHGVLAWA